MTGIVPLGKVTPYVSETPFVLLERVFGQGDKEATTGEGKRTFAFTL
ncbi:MAG: hypothetical protein LBG18_00210 [Mediterranea sp.]|jgi:hypothetical protein|nr:hypothetical protein [Mediterranea sp.]